MAPLAPGKSTFRLEPTNNVLSDGHSNAESPESSRKIYTISELMKMRNIDLMQPAKVFNTPVVNEILRHDLNQSPIYILCPQTQLDLMKPTDNLPNRLRQFHHQRTRHNTRSYEELNPRMGAFAQKRNSRHSNGELFVFLFAFQLWPTIISFRLPHLQMFKSPGHPVRRFESVCAFKKM